MIEHYESQYEIIAKRNDPEWIKTSRSNAFESFQTQGIPHSQMEAWRYTHLHAWKKNRFTAQTHTGGELKPHEIQLFSMLNEHCYDIVFVDGQYHPHLSSKKQLENVILLPLAQAIVQYPEAIKPYLGKIACLDRHPFSSLCVALAEHGMVMIVPDNVTVVEPIHLLFTSSKQSDGRESHLRNLFIIGNNAKVEIIEHYVDLDDVTYFNNVLTEVLLNNHAQLSHYKIEQEGTKSFHIGSLQVKQNEGSEFISNAITLSGFFSRHDITTDLIAPHSKAILNGLYFPHHQQHVDYHTAVTHSAPHCASDSLYKGILSGRSTSVFNGAVVVKPYAEKTQSKQANHNLLLSAGSEANSKPELEIHADDVKCSHGATTGQLNEEAIFFLQSRGIALSKARRMLIRAFANEVLNAMPSQMVRDYCQRYLEMAAYE